MKVYYHTYSLGYYPDNFIGARDHHAEIDKEEWCCKQAENNLFVYSIQNVYDLCFFFGRTNDEFPFHSHDNLKECPYCHEPIKAIFRDVKNDNVKHVKKKKK